MFGIGRLRHPEIALTQELQKSVTPDQGCVISLYMLRDWNITILHNITEAPYMSRYDASACNDK